MRQAFEYAIDRSAIIQAVEKGYGQVGELGDRAGVHDLLRPVARQRSTRSTPDMAKQLLAEAGWTPGPNGVLQKDGQPFQFTMDVGQRGVLQPTNELIQQNLKAVGIQADLNSMEWNAYIQKVVVNRDYTATVQLVGLSERSGRVPVLPQQRGWQGLQHPRVQGRQARCGARPRCRPRPMLAKRKQDVTNLQTLMADKLPYVFLWYPQEIDVVNANLQGVPDLNLRDGMHYVQEWSLKK